MFRIVDNKILNNCRVGEDYMLSDIFAGVVFGFLDSLKLIFYICKFRIEGSVDEGGRIAYNVRRSS